METLRARIDLLGRPVGLLALYAAIVGALSAVSGLPNALDGEAVGITRTLLGVWGVAASLLAWTLRQVVIDGWQALMAWSIAQVPFIAWSLNGNPTTQLWDFLLGVTNTVTINGEITVHERYGINLVGVALCIVGARGRERWERRVRPRVAKSTASRAET